MIINIKRIIKSNFTAYTYSLSSVIMSIAQMITGILIIRWVSPEDMGVWNTIVIFQAYVQFLNFGQFSGLNRELPYLLGQNETKKAYSLSSSTLAFSKILMVLFSIVSILLTIYLLIVESIGFNFIFATAILSLVIITGFYSSYLNVTYRSNSAFNSLTRIYFYQTFIIVISILLVPLWGYYGMIIRKALIAISILIMMHINRPLPFILPKFEFQYFRQLFRTGMPIYIYGYLTDIANTIDKVLLLSMAGTLAVGLYSPALSILSAMSLLPNVLGTYLYPKLSFNYGKLNNKQELFKILMKYIAGLSIVLLPLTIIGWFIMPTFIGLLFPNYIEGIFACQISMVTGFFMSFTVVINVLNTTKAWKSLFVLLGLKWIFNVSIIYFSIRLINPIDGVAVGLLVASIFFSIASIFIVKKELSIKKY